MKQTDFLTVMAVLDDETQRKMAAYQQRILSLGLTGTQTMGIPFHITLGSFSPSCESKVKANIQEACRTHSVFPLGLPQLNTFETACCLPSPR